MKKLLIVPALACAAALFAVAGCGERGGVGEEEQFNSAKAKFDNYTVDVQINYSEGGGYESTLMVDGANGMVTGNYIGEEEGESYYYKEEDGEVFQYEASDWVLLRSADTIEEATSEVNGYVYMVENLFYDDFESVGGELVVTDEALEAYSEQYGMDISSCRVKLSGSTIASATVVVNYYGERMEVNYSFSDYGTTEVELPE